MGVRLKENVVVGLWIAQSISLETLIAKIEIEVASKLAPTKEDAIVYSLNSLDNRTINMMHCDIVATEA